MNCRVGAVVRRGEAVPVHQPVDPQRVARAVRAEGPVEERPTVAVQCPDPGPAHGAVGYITPERSLRVRTALAAAARARGLETPHDSALADARKELRALAVEHVTRTDERRELADERAETERLRERVAAARGRLQAAQEGGGDATEASEDLSDAVRELSEVETRAAAAEQRLERSRERARAARDRLERRFELEDRVANLEREARAHLVEQVQSEYAESVAAAPDPADGGPTGDCDPFEVDAVTAALAVARVARPDAPVVLACDRFESADAAREWLDAPVIYIR